ncbi:MAG: hypothetical protein ACLGJC_04710 [Alphaproteobacteria bacterium]
MNVLRILFAAILAVAPISAMAQDKSHGHSHTAPHGGQIQNIGTYEAELVVKGTELTLYLVDKDEKEVPSNGFEATAVVLAKDGQKPVALKPNGNNKLTGTADFTYEGKFRATVTLTSAGKEVGKGRYSLDAAKR